MCAIVSWCEVIILKRLMFSLCHIAKNGLLYFGVIKLNYSKWCLLLMHWCWSGKQFLFFCCFSRLQTEMISRSRIVFGCLSRTRNVNWTMWWDMMDLCPCGNSFNNVAVRLRIVQYIHLFFRYVLWPAAAEMQCSSLSRLFSMFSAGSWMMHSWWWERHITRKEY